MTCKCGHDALAHPYDPSTPLNPYFPCLKCDCRDYDMAPKEAGF